MSTSLSGVHFFIARSIDTNLEQLIYVDDSDPDRGPICHSAASRKVIEITLFDALEELSPEEVPLVVRTAIETRQPIDMGKLPAHQLRRIVNNCSLRELLTGLAQ